MKYKGALYGKVGKTYFPLQETSEDFDMMKKALKEIKNFDETSEYDDPGQIAIEALSKL